MGQNRRAMRWLRWLGPRLLAAAALLTLALTGWHWARGAPLGDALRMMADDYRLLTACPAEAGRVRAFAGRATPDSGPASMSARHGDGWTARVCDGSLAPDAAATAGVSAEAVRASPSPTPSPASSPTPSATPSPASAAPSPTATIAATATVTPAATSTPSPTPTATPASPSAALTCGAWHAPSTALDDLPEGARPAERHGELKRFMLALINAERAAAGARPVALGGNAAAQLHAEEALAGCFSSHWGRDGLKPAMRYSLAGGYQANAENLSGLDYCVTAADGYRAIASPEEEAREAMEGLMGSEGHRENILNPRHRAVSLGLAWDEWNFIAVQHFEGDYVAYGRAPAITGGLLSLAGETRNGAAFATDDDLGVQVYYDPPPRPLTRGQLARTYCYDSGRIVAALRAPPGPFERYTSDELTATRTPCPDPYAVPADAPAPQSHDEAHAAWQAAYDASQASVARSVHARWITAEEWVADGQRFAVTADLSELLAEHGAGVYSLAVWGAIEGERAVISEYAIFCE